MRLGRAPLLGLCGALLLGAGSCLFGGVHEQCHRRALEQLGCCPFHGEECGGLAYESIKKACSEELASLSPVDEGETGAEGEKASAGEGDAVTTGDPQG